MDLSYATASELTAALATGRSVEPRAARPCRSARIDEVNPPLNAVVALDAERARTRGRGGRCRAALAATRLGPLHGLVMTVKDVWETEGLRHDFGRAGAARPRAATAMP